MSITLATTTIRIERPATTDLEGDPWGEEAAEAPPALVASGVPAHLSQHGGGALTSGDQETERRRMVCDIVAGFDHLCRVTDELTGKRYKVTSVDDIRADGSMSALDHHAAELVRITGQAE